MKLSNQYQKRVNDWVNRHASGYWTPHQMLARLVEEVGELAKEVNHDFGPKKKKKSDKPSSRKEELGDIFFTLICMHNAFGLDLAETFQMAMDKCYGRDLNRFKRKA